MTLRYLLRLGLWIAGFAALLLLGAGDWGWPAAWTFVAEYGVMGAALVIWLARHDPALLRERFANPFHRDQARWDRGFMLAIVPLFPAWLVLMGVDARRCAWSHVPVALQAFGAILFAGSILVAWLTFRANTFAVPQARIQADRRQTVIRDGPYAYVRHPMYAGALLFFAGLPLMLGSWLGLIAVPVLGGALAARIIGEERMLRHALPGYDAYAAQVRYRLIPGLW